MASVYLLKFSLYFIGVLLLSGESPEYNNPLGSVKLPQLHFWYNSMTGYFYKGKHCE